MRIASGMKNIITWYVSFFLAIQQQSHFVV